MVLELETLKKAKTAIGQSATLTSIGASAGAIMAIMALLSFMHINVIPFAWASDVDDIKSSIEKLTEAINEQTKSTLEIQLDKYKTDLEAARDDLAKNPGSRSAKNEVSKLETLIEETVKKIDRLEALEKSGHN